MFAFLFDRKSGVLTGIAVAALVLILFGGGVLLGLSLRWSREEAVEAVMNPNQAADWLTAKPTVNLKAKPSAPPAGQSAAAAPAEAPSAAGEAATSEAPEPAAGAAAAPASGAPADDWVPMTEGGAPPSPDSPPRFLSGGSYVQVGAYASSTRAEETRAALAARFRGADFAPFLASLSDRGPAQVAVRLGPFASRAAAQRVAGRLERAVVGRGE
jgi:cell division septation protein DedD